MEELKEISPAELKVFLAPRVSKVGELLHLTFLDLVKRGVLKYTENEYREVEAGPKLTENTYKAHEALFTEIFQQNKELKITLSELLSLVKEGIKTTTHFKWHYLIKSTLRRYYYQATSYSIYRFLFAISLNYKGVLSRDELLAEYQSYEEAWKDGSIDENIKRNLLDKVGGNELKIRVLFGDDFLKNEEAIKEGKERVEEGGFIEFMDGDTIDVLIENTSEYFLDSFEITEISTDSGWFSSWGSDSGGWFSGGDSDNGCSSSGCSSSGCSGCGGGCGS
ncbi:hypothetical protein [Sediminitomix flava]|uniref:Uncharacterized protein n=1 Tax=Sediminitomix flava TaxID=379075 RepID=A0A315Z0G8_SEDFL|nr:hypothetical protein [Sediminitomix flava]PWJ36133.1 hypothetical protein BC781_109149 [Sediminitomix flava]